MCAIVSEHEHLSLWIVNENTSKRFGRSQGMNEKPGQTSDNIRYQDVFFTAVAWYIPTGYRSGCLECVVLPVHNI